MKRIIKYTIIMIFFTFLFCLYAGAEYQSDVIDKVKITNGEIPEGFMFGKVPEPYSRVIKGNPWLMDQGAINKLAPRIYPGGDAHTVKGIHITILANKRKPFGDDIVCYIIMFSSTSAAEKEIKKLSEYAGYNNDRALVMSRGNLAIYMHVDDTRNYKLLKSMAATLQGRLEHL